MTAEPKPLAVGDRVRHRPNQVLTVTNVDQLDRGFAWAGPGGNRERLFRAADLERIDPAPPAGPATTPAERRSIAAAGLIGGLTADEAIRTLTAQRDRAIDERDTALARATRAEKLLATLEDRHQ